MRNVYFLCFVMIAAVVLAACNLQISTGADNPAVAIAAQTIVAQAATMTALAGQSSAALGTPAPSGACDQAQFIADITVPDGTAFNPNKNFTKTWELKNIGTCTWTTAYTLSFYNGEAMSGPTALNLTGPVAPGQSIDLSVALISPNSPGSYRGYWILRNANGALVPIVDGYQGQSFYVQISVVSKPVVVVVTATATSPSKVKIPKSPILLNPGIILLIPSPTPTIDFSKLIPLKPIFPLP